MNIYTADSTQWQSLEIYITAVYAYRRRMEREKHRNTKNPNLADIMKETPMNVPTKLKFYKDVALIYKSSGRGNHLGAVLGAERTGLRGGEEKELEFSWGERLIESTYQSSAAGALEKLREHPWFNAMGKSTCYILCVRMHISLFIKLFSYVYVCVEVLLSCYVFNYYKISYLTSNT